MVTVKLMRVVSAWISGGKCGFDNFVCKNNLHKRATDGTVTEEGNIAERTRKQTALIIGLIRLLILERHRHSDTKHAIFPEAHFFSLEVPTTSR